MSDRQIANSLNLPLAIGRVDRRTPPFLAVFFVLGGTDEELNSARATNEAKNFS